MKKTLIFTASTALFAAQMVVYPNFAYVKEKRDVQKGIIAPLPRTINKDSVHVCGSKGFYIRHKQDLRRLLKKSLHKGQKVRFRKFKDVLIGTILSVDPLIIKTGDRIIFKVDYLDIIYDELPTLAVLEDRIELLDKSLRSCEVEYLTGGVRWSSNYIATAEDTKLHLQGYIRIQNSSGYDFKNLKLSVLAGDVRSGPLRPTYPRRVYKGMVTSASEAATIKEESVEGYHKYELAGRWNLKDGDDLWAPYVDEKIDYKKILRCRCSDLGYNFRKREYRFDQIFEFTAPKALPRGKVRFYAQNTFLGEAFIPNRAKKEKVSVAVGKEFDLLLKKRVLEFDATKKRVQVEVEYSLKNAKNKMVEVEIEELLPFSNYRIQSEKNYKKRGAADIVYRIKIPANSKLTFKANYTFFK